jgi:hypothetical protein
MLSPSLTSTTVLFASIAFGTWSNAALAETELASPVARLDVESPPSCTTRAELAARVLARAPRVRFVDTGGELTVRATFVVQASGDVTSEVLFTKQDGSASSRHLVARSCLEAANAVALIVAVTLDPTAVTPDRGARNDEGITDPGEPTSPAAPESARSEPAPARPKQPDAAAEDPPSAGRGPEDWRFGAYLSVQALVGPAPKAMPAATVHALLELERSALWSPALFVGFTHAFGTSIGTGANTSGARAVFTLDAATLDACPLRFELPGFDARACGSALLGRLSAAGRSTYNSPGVIGRPFWVVGGAAVLTAPLGSWLEVSGRAGVGANLLRDSFEFTPVPFHTVGPVTVGVSLGLGARTP